MHPFATKTARLAIWYIAGCALLFALARSERLAWCANWRHAVLRELVRSSELREADVLFFGSSRTARGVVPDVLERRYRAITGRELRPLNLAVMGVARHIGYLELVDWLRDHPAPAMVVVEIGNGDLVEYPHQTLTRFMQPADTARILWEHPYDFRSSEHFRERVERYAGGIEGGPRDLVFRKRLFDPFGVFVAMDQRTMHLELALEHLGRGPEDAVRILWNRLHNAGVACAARLLGEDAPGWARDVPPGMASFPYWDHETPITPAGVAQQVGARGWYLIGPESPVGRAGKKTVVARAEEWSVERALSEVRADGFQNPRRYRVSKLYSRLTAELCRERGIRLVFAELPVFRAPQLGRDQIEFYEELGDVFQPDPARLQEIRYFQDTTHLSAEGAKLFSEELARHLAGLPKSPPSAAAAGKTMPGE